MGDSTLLYIVCIYICIVLYIVVLSCAYKIQGKLSITLICYRGFGMRFELSFGMRFDLSFGMRFA